MPARLAIWRRHRGSSWWKNNATGQFADVIQLQTGITANEEILKYDGMPFSVEELTEQIGELNTGGDDNG